MLSLWPSASGAPVVPNNKTVDIAISKLTEAGAKRAVKLPVSVPFHCNLLKEAAEKFKQEFEYGREYFFLIYQ